MTDGARDLSTCTDAEEHRRAFVEGLKQWHSFVRSCLDDDGPTGVFNSGPSFLETELRREADASLEETALGSAFGIVRMFADLRLRMVNSHVAATAALLSDDDALPSLPAAVRAWCEGAARALWLLDPDIGGLEMLERALTDVLAESDRLRRVGRREEGPVDAYALEIAAAAGVHPKRKAPPAVHLIRAYHGGDLERPVEDWEAAWIYARGSSVVHSGIVGWMLGAVAGFRIPEMEIEALRAFLTDAITALELHVAAMDAWTGLQEWSPIGAFEEAWSGAVTRTWLPFVQLDEAVRYANGEDDG